MQPKATFRKFNMEVIMANWCSIEAEIVCFDGRGAETLYQKLLMDKTEADKRSRGFYIGSNRYFFDSIIEVNDYSALWQIFIQRLNLV